MTTINKLNEANMLPTESVQNTWTVTAAEGTTREETLNAVFWVHVARKLRPLAEINVIAEDGSWYQKLLCLLVDGADVRMKELGFWELDDTSDVSDSSDVMRVQWGGPYHLFRVVRNADGVVLSKGFRSRADAQRWIAGNTRVAA